MEPYSSVIKDAKDRAQERRFIAFVETTAVKEEVDRMYPDDFRTRSGPLLDQDQVSCVLGGNIPTHGQAFDALKYAIEKARVAPLGVIRDGETKVAGSRSDTKAPNLPAPPIEEVKEEAAVEEDNLSSAAEESEEEEMPPKDPAQTKG